MAMDSIPTPRKQMQLEGSGVRKEFTREDVPKAKRVIIKVPRHPPPLPPPHLCFLPTALPTVRDTAPSHGLRAAPTPLGPHGGAGARAAAQAVTLGRAGGGRWGRRC